MRRRSEEEVGGGGRRRRSLEEDVGGGESFQHAIRFVFAFLIDTFGRMDARPIHTDKHLINSSGSSA